MHGRDLIYALEISDLFAVNENAMVEVVSFMSTISGVQSPFSLKFDGNGVRYLLGGSGDASAEGD